MTADTRHDAVEDVVDRGLTDVEHVQDISVGELRLNAELGVTDYLTVALRLPLRVLDTSIRYVDAAGNDVNLTNENIHHRNETLVGLADAWLTGRLRHRLSRFDLGLQAGVSLPLGRTEPDPFVLGDMGLRHQHVQFGTGTFNPIVGIDAATDAGPVRLSAYAITEQMLYENGHDYQAGDRYAGGVWASSGLSTRTWRFGAGLDMRGETAERWDGIVYKEDGNQGRFDLLAGVRVSRQIGLGMEVEANVKVPLYTHVVGGQLEYPLIAELGIRHSFELFGGKSSGGGGHDHEHGEHEHGEHEHGEHEHGEHDHGQDEHDHGDDEHDHEDEHPGEHGDEHGHGKLDIADLTDTGEAVELEPVAGKVTVFDFWAPWCAPCKDLEAGLEKLAEQHPDRLAIRRINIVDWDSPASQRYLAKEAFNLPHLVVVDAGGRQVLRRSASPAELIEAVRALVEP